MKLLFALKHVEPVEMLPKDRWGVLDLTPERAEEWATLTESVQSGEAVSRQDYAGTTFYPEFEEPPLVPLKTMPVQDEGYFNDFFDSPLEVDGIRVNPLYRTAPIAAKELMDVDECRLEVRADVLRIIAKVQEHQFCIELTPKFLREILPASDNAKPPPEPERDPMYDEYLAVMAEQAKQG